MSQADPLKTSTTAKRRAPTQQRRTETEDRLVKAAIAIFSKKGYDGATTKAIAQSAGVNEALIIRYFGGKEGLYLETIRRFLENKRANPLPYPPQSTLADELVENIRKIFSDMETNSDCYKLLLGRSTIDNKLRKKINNLMPKTGDPRLLERIQALRSKGEIPKGMPDEIITLIPFQAFITLYFATTSLSIDIDLLKQKLEFLVRASVAGLFTTCKK